MRQAAADPTSASSVEAIRATLRSKRAHAVAAAARLAGQAGLRDLLGELVAAFPRFIDGGAEVDPGCKAKGAIASALHQLGHDDPDFFLRHVTLVQRDPVWGGSVDTAADVRSACALALAALWDDRVVPALTALLLDPEWVARLHAARALGGTGRPEAEAVLRLKALAGDPEPQVATEVYLALLALSPRASLAFVQAALDEQDDPGAGTQHELTAAGPVRGDHCSACGSAPLARHAGAAAALALGQSRLDGAFEALRRHAERAHPDRQRVALLGIAMVRSTEAIDYLIAQVERGELEAADGAVEALAMHRYDEALRRRVESAVSARGEARLLRTLRRAFGTAAD